MMNKKILLNFCFRFTYFIKQISWFAQFSFDSCVGFAKFPPNSICYEKKHIFHDSYHHRIVRRWTKFKIRLFNSQWLIYRLKFNTFFLALLHHRFVIRIEKNLKPHIHQLNQFFFLPTAHLFCMEIHFD